MTVRGFFQALKSGWGLSVAVLAAGPLGLWAPGLDPPWPDGSAAVALVVCFVAVWIAFALTRFHLRATTILVIGVASLIGGVIVGGFYFYEYSRSVVTISIPTEDGERLARVVVGSDLKGPGPSEGRGNMDLLLDHGFDAEAIWTQQSIGRARLLLLLCFVFSFSLLTFGSAVLASNANKRKVRA